MIRDQVCPSSNKLSLGIILITINISTVMIFLKYEGTGILLAYGQRRYCHLVFAYY